MADLTEVVYEKNLGKDTAEMAKAMTAFNPDKTWRLNSPQADVATLDLEASHRKAE